MCSNARDDGGGASTLVPCQQLDSLLATGLVANREELPLREVAAAVVVDRQPLVVSTNTRACKRELMRCNLSFTRRQKDVETKLARERTDEDSARQRQQLGAEITSLGQVSDWLGQWAGSPTRARDHITADGAYVAVRANLQR